MFNNKGGVGKTTLVCNLASYMAIYLRKKVLLIDADPQCNSTVNLLTDEIFESVYYDKNGFTIYDMLRPLHRGVGYSKSLTFNYVPSYKLDFLVGDPRLSLMEDLLSTDWQDAISGMPRGLRTTLVFSELLSRCSEYDFIFFDMGPSLGLLNRSILLACDYFLMPMSSDIFSLLAIENIGQTLETWKNRFNQGLSLNEDTEALSGLDTTANLKFLGYVTQQYTAKTVDGIKRPVKAYEQILDEIPQKIKSELIDLINITQEFLRIALGQIQGDTDFINQLLLEKDYLTTCEIIVEKLQEHNFNEVAIDCFLRPGFDKHQIHETIFKLDSRIVATPNVDKIYATIILSSNLRMIIPFTLKNIHTRDFLIPQFPLQIVPYGAFMYSASSFFVFVLIYWTVLNKSDYR